MNETIASVAQRLAVLLAVALAAPAAAPAAVLDRSFGDHGRVEHWVADQESADTWSEPAAIWPARRGRVVIAAPFPLRLTAAGTIDRSFGRNGFLPVYDNDYQRLPGGRWLFDAGHGIRPSDRDGHVLPHASRFTRTVASRGGDDSEYGFVGLGDGSVLDLVTVIKTGATKIRLGDGKVLHRRVTVGDDPRLGDVGPNGAVLSGSGAIASTGGGVIRLRGDGSLDPSWGLRYVTLSRELDFRGMAPWGGGGVALLCIDDDHGTDVLLLIDRGGRLVRRITLSRRRWDERYHDPQINYTLSTGGHGRILLAHTDYDRKGITVRRYAGTHRDPAFGRGGRVRLHASHRVLARGMTVLPDGRIVVLGELEKFGTVLLPEEPGSADDGWERHGTVVWRLRDQCGVQRKATCWSGVRKARPT